MPERRMSSDEELALVDLVNRVLDKGAVISGDITISVAGVDLIYLGLNVILSSVESMRGRMLPP
ncbi:MAG TPA: gas vesicle protein [Longimicrobiales bacterium]|nr:gas vesicle protein [Longimicrobiales bacterium]